MTVAVLYGESSAAVVFSSLFVYCILTDILDMSQSKKGSRDDVKQTKQRSSSQSNDLDDCMTL